MLQPRRCMALWLISAVSAHTGSEISASPRPIAPAAAPAEITRGAASGGAAIRARLTHEATRRMFGNCVEKNLQKGRDSDGFRLGVHMVAAYWILALPEDVTWRTKSIA